MLGKCVKEELPGLEAYKCDVSDAKAVQKISNDIFAIRSH